MLARRHTAVARARRLRPAALPHRRTTWPLPWKTIVYHVYANNGAGGPVDYTSIVATTNGLSYQTGALTFPGQYTFAVRAFGVTSQLEESNVDARRRLVLDSSGNDITALPNPPVFLTVFVTANGGATVIWSYNPGAQGGAPTGFHVYVGTPTPNYASAVQTVPYAAGRSSFSCTLSGLTGGTVYQIGVRAYNATGEEQNATVKSITAAGTATAPAPVDGLTGTAVP